DGEPSTPFGQINRQAARQVFQSRNQLARLARRGEGRGGDAADARRADSDEIVLRAILAGYPDRVARRREPGSRRGVMVGGRGVRLDDASTVLDDELFVCVDVEA